MHILLTNDDGLTAPGLQAAYAALKERGHQVTVCAPDGQRSAASHSVTLRTRLKVTPLALPDGALGFAVQGTPADCARLGFSALAKDPVDMVISGINDDLNLGFDINYSGTVGAALEAAAAGYPALAASVERADDYDWKRAVHVLLAVVDNFSSWNIPLGTAVNLNIPDHLSTGRNDWFWARPQMTPSDDYFEGEPNDDGSVSYQRLRDLSQEMVTADDQAGFSTDVAHIRNGHITLSPIIAHSCHEATLARLAVTNKR